MDFRRMADKFITKLANNDVIIKKFEKRKAGSAIERIVTKRIQCKAAIKYLDKKLSENYGDIPGVIQFIVSEINLDYSPSIDDTLINFNRKRL